VQSCKEALHLGIPHAKMVTSDQAEMPAPAPNEQILRQRSAGLAEDHIYLSIIVSTQALKSSMGNIGKPLATGPRLLKTRRQRARVEKGAVDYICVNSN
jgi:hypothetical protein